MNKSRNAVLMTTYDYEEGPKAKDKCERGEQLTTHSWNGQEWQRAGYDNPAQTTGTLPKFRALLD